MTTFEVRFTWSQEARDAHFLTTGEHLETEGRLTVDCTTLTPDQRRTVLAWEKARMGLSVRICRYVDRDTLYSPVAEPLPLDAMPSVDDVLEHMRRMIYEHARVQEAVNERAERQREQEAERRAAEERYNAERRERARLEREAFEAARAVWVAEHGSAHLRRAVEAGYDCTRLYLTERAALEYPDYTLDFDDHAKWESRCCPSEEALAEAEARKGQVVWLVAAPPQVEFYCPREAVIVKDPTYRDHVLIRGFAG